MMKLTDYLGDLHRALANTEATRGTEKLELDEGLNLAVEMILSCRETAKIMIVGNGGSAAIAAHLQNDLCNSVGLRAMEFTAQPLLTALANDFGYDRAFPIMVEKWANPDDVLIAISSSGKSTNILGSVEKARLLKARVITFSGFDALNPLRAAGDLNFHVPSNSYGYVETAHATLGHYLTDQATARLSSQSSASLLRRNLQ